MVRLPRSVKSFLKLPVLLGLLACLLALCLPVERSFSDTFYLVGRVEAGAPPYYNVAYVPLGRLFKGLFGGWLGTEGALLLLSAVAVGAAVAVTVKLTLELGAGRLGSIVAGLLLGCAPGVLFFGGVIEVHSVQLLGASLAIYLAWRARLSRPGMAWFLLATAGLIAMLAHLSNLLLLPGLLAFAWKPSTGAPSGCRFTRRGLPVFGLVGAVVGIGAALLATSDFETWSVHPALQWLGTLLVFGEIFLGGLAQRGFFSASEAAGYLGSELVLPFGLLCFGLGAGLVLAFSRGPMLASSHKRSFARRSLLACLPALLVLPQGGVLERGGYFMSYAPLLAVLAGLGGALLLSQAPQPALDSKPAGSGRGQRVRLFRASAFVAVLVVAQFSLALNERQGFRAKVPEASIWARAVSQLVQPGDSVLVGSLSRTFALATAAPKSHVRDLDRDLALVPDAVRILKLESVLSGRLADLRYPGDLWIDASLLPGLTSEDLAGESVGNRFSAPWQVRLIELLTRKTGITVNLETLALGDPNQLGLAGFESGSSLNLVRIRR